MVERVVTEPAPTEPVRAETLEIVRLGASGDGIAEGPNGPVFVPGALAGERVSIEREGGRVRLVAVERASPDRAEPFCPYYDRCGGCVAQHMAPALYRTWKTDGLAHAMRWAGLDAVPADLVDAHGAGRRRVVFHGREIDGAIAVGFMARRSHSLVAVDRCPVTEPGLADAAPAAARIARETRALGKPIDLAVTATEEGLDIDLRGTGRLPERVRQRLVAVAIESGLARLSVHGETIVAPRRPRIAMAGSSITPPAGGFLQATAAGEAVLAGLVADGCRGAKRVADLFAGCGPFTLRLAATAAVHAVEQDPAALAALDRAARETPGLRRVTTETRDLFRRPLLSTELAGFDAVVLDPPRAGAEAQIRQLATAGAPETVVLVSCDPGTFARDAAVLAEAGFRVERVTPVDQFKWTAHLETVGVFKRPAARKRRR